ncbi:MAG: sigma 54-interacting transcriptional regulator [Opitutales bacterium]
MNIEKSSTLDNIKNPRYKKCLVSGLLYKISEVIAKTENINKFSQELLNTITQELNLNNASFQIKEDNSLNLEAFYSNNNKNIQNAIAKITKKISNRVAKTATSIIEENILESNISDTKDNLSIICVPIMHEDYVIATLAVDKISGETQELLSDLECLENLSSLIAKTILRIYAQKEELEILQEENTQLKLELNEKRPNNIIGNSSAMKKVYKQIANFAKRDCAVLIEGESGTGKSLMAKAIYNSSESYNKFFVPIQSYTLSDTLFASELFGHEKDSFEGASSAKKGLLDKLKDATIFIGEIAQLSKANQLKLIELIQDKTYTSLGSNIKKQSNIRLIMSTSYKLEELVKNSLFSEELYILLNNSKLRIPPLRSRRSDIMLLSEFFMEKYSIQKNKKIDRISTPAINMLMAYHWPVNVKELENCIEKAVLTATSGVILGYNLPPSLQTGQSTSSAKVPSENETDFSSMVNSFERELITEALKLHKGNASMAAKHLNISQRIINYKIRKFGVKLEWFKNKSSTYFVKKRMLLQKNNPILD